MLQNFVKSAARNADRKKAGYRFDDLTKMFASYIFMLAGPLAYETLHANLPLSIPSISTVRRFITDKDPRVVEGHMRDDELFKYLSDRNLPKKISLSEDATRITAKVSYDPATNQLIGFVLPLNENGMPIPLSFPARSAGEIQNHFLNPSNIVSSTAQVQMAQPFSESTSPFCLMVNLTGQSYTAQSVLNRWRFQATKLKEKGILIDNISTDGDSKALLAMKILSRIGQSDDSYFDCEWFSCGGYVETTFVQDTVHILTKLRNRLLTCSRIFPIGFWIVSMSHVKYLIENVSKDKHLLTIHDIEPKDRQNYLSAEKISSEKSIQCLIDYVPGSDATVLYLKAMQCIRLAFLDEDLQSKDRIYNIWRAVFIFRAWRSWIVNSEKTNDPINNKSKRVYTLKDNFISTNCYTCIEINAHTIVKKLLIDARIGDSSARKDCSEKGEHFFSNLYGSQPCESMFRQIRSFTSTFSTVVNFNMFDILHRINKLQLQSDIINHSNGVIKFPRFEKKNKIRKTSNNVLCKLDRAAITLEIERAKKDVIFDMEALGIITSKLNFKCQVEPAFEQNLTELDDDSDDDSDDMNLFFNDSNDYEEMQQFENHHSDYLSGIKFELLATFLQAVRAVYVRFL